MRNARSLPRSLTAVCCYLIMLGATASGAFAQGTTPQRGFNQGNSFSISDIETISMTGANLMLNFPFGKLPAGRGGLSAQLSLTYSSKIYDSHVQYEPDPSQPINNQTGEHPIVQRNMLWESSEGGWRYAVGYQLKVISRLEEYPFGYEPQYPDQRAKFRYKLRMSFPDGSEREFIPRGFNSHQLLNDGYYDLRPDGWRSVWVSNGCAPAPCAWVEDQPFYSGTITYYSTDGTYARLDIQHDADDNFYNNPWTLYLSDGGRVTGGNAPQRIYDRNNNYVEIQRYLNANGHSITKLVDQLGREVTLEQGYAPNEDAIRVNGVGGMPLTYRIKWKTVQVYKTYTTAGESPNGFPDTLNTLYVVSEVILPPQAGGLKYTFGYNAADLVNGPLTPSHGWGELSSVTLPSGAKVNYQYGLDGLNGDVSWDTVLRNAPTRKDLIYRLEYDGAPVSNLPCDPMAETSCVTETWLYSLAGVLTTLGLPGGGTVTGPNGGVASEFADHYGQVYKSVRPDGTVVERIWRHNVPENHPQMLGYYSVNGYVKTEFTSVRDAGNNLSQTAIVDYEYDKNGNVTAAKQYDWVSYGAVQRDAEGRPTGVPANLTPVRVTTNKYYAETPNAQDAATVDADAYYMSTSPQLRGAVKATEVGSATQTFSRVEFFYDDAATTGNLIQQKTWDSTRGPRTDPLTASNSASATYQYDAYGNVTLATDARGFQTQTTYGPINGQSGLYPTRVKGAYGQTIQRTAANEYDFHTGLLTRTTDVDNNISTSTSYDVLGRPILLKAAEGTPEEAHVVTEHSDLARRVILRSDLDATGDGKMVTIRHYDQLGRLRLARQLEDAAAQSAADEIQGIKVQTRYLYHGGFSYTLASQPYRAATPGGTGEQIRGWSRTKFDKVGRTVEIQTFEGAGLPAPWGSNSASTGAVLNVYDGEYTTVTDQAGKVRRTRMDALGRLARVDEPDGNGNLGPQSAPVQPTSYTYDALGNLRKVDQGGQARHFMYDSLSRLIRVKNPEQDVTTHVEAPSLLDPVTGNNQWSLAFDYDANGNIVKRIDARNIKTTYAYDGLNRNTTVDYSDTPGVNPDVTHSYDSATLGKGRPWKSQTHGAGGTIVTIVSYDALGRPLLQSYQFNTATGPGPIFSSQRTYDRVGHVLSQSYPSGRSVSYDYDEGGRLIDFRGTLGDATTRVYSTGVVYDALGRMKREQFGTATPLYNKRFYNSRGQLAEIRLGTYHATDDGWWNRGAILNVYSPTAAWTESGGSNNGSLRKQMIFVPNGDNPMADGWWETTLFYDYDSLNRLDKVREVQGGVNLWMQDYDYDRWGNRTINQTSTQVYGQNPTYSIPETQYDVRGLAGSNRLYAPGDLDSGKTDSQRLMNYDGAGNLTKDTYTGGGLRTYDANNRMTSAQFFNGQVQTATYTYDAHGRRVKRNLPASGEVWMVYGLDGELLAEYPANGDPASPRKEYGYRAGELLVTAEPGGAAEAKLTPTAITASGTYGANAPANAADSNPSTSWVSSGFPQQWIQYDLGQARTLTRVRLLVSQDPTGQTTHQVWGGLTPTSLTLLGTLGGVTQSGQWLELTTGATGVRYVRVLTTQSPSWVAWREVEVYGLAGVADVRWLVADQLGTPRMVFDQTGSLAGGRRQDFLPFGESLRAGAAGRTTERGYAYGAITRQQFTGYEWEEELGLDYAQARYFSPTMGRFTSVDPVITNIKNLFDPQRINLYTYASNNPLVYVDPTGEYVRLTGDGRKEFLLWLEGATGVDLEIDEQGYVRVVGEIPSDLTANQRALLAIIKNPFFVVEVAANLTDNTVIVDRYDGSIGPVGMLTVNVSNVKTLAQPNGITPESEAAHVIVEGFLGAVNQVQQVPDMPSIHFDAIKLGENGVRADQGLSPRKVGEDRPPIHLQHRGRELIEIQIDFGSHIQALVVEGKTNSDGTVVPTSKILGTKVVPKRK
jgi:RHS repeat-associated protein